jgi:hypothetical protein
MPALALDLGALAAFLFLLLIAAALWVLIRIIEGSFGKAPVIGSWISRDIGGWLNDARNATLKAAGATWGFAVHLFDWVGRFFVTMFKAIGGTFAAFGETVWHIATVQIPAVENRAAGYAMKLYDQANAYVVAVEHTVESDILRVEVAVTAKAVSLFQSALAYAQAGLATLRSDVTAGLAAVEATAANDVLNASTVLSADIAAAERTAAADVAALAATTAAGLAQAGRDITAGVATAEAVAAARLDAVRGVIYTDLDTWGTDALKVAWPDASGDIAALRLALGADFPDIAGLLDALAGAGALGLIGTLIRSMATSQAITKLATDCIVPNCRNLSGFGKDLQELLGVVSGASFLAWLVFTIAEPAAAARDTETVIHGLVDGTVTAARDLFGVR